MQRAEYNTNLHVKIPAGLMARLRQEAERRMTSVSEIVRQAALDRLETAEQQEPE